MKIKSLSLRSLRIAGLHVGLFAIGTSHAQQKPIHSLPAVAVAGAIETTQQRVDGHLWMTIGARRFSVKLADTEAARAFAERLPMKLDMSDLNGNEKKFDLAKSLPSNPIRPGKIRNGDLMLYGDSTVVLFYKSFDSAYPYTRLGQAEDPEDLAQALGRGSARVDFSMP